MLTGWIAGIAHISSLPILFLSFVEHQFSPQLSSLNWLPMYGVLVAISAFLAFVNYRGLDVVANATVLIFFLSTAPFVVLVIIGIPKSEKTVLWRVLFFYINEFIEAQYVILCPFEVNTSNWLQTPNDGVVTIEGNLIVKNGFFPLPTIAGIACEYSENKVMRFFCLSSAH